MRSYCQVSSRIVSYTEVLVHVAPSLWTTSFQPPLTCLNNTQSAMIVSGADEKGELPRGWNWVDVVKVRTLLISLIWSPKMMMMIMPPHLFSDEHNLFCQLPHTACKHQRLLDGYLSLIPRPPVYGLWKYTNRNWEACEQGYSHTVCLIPRPSVWSCVNLVSSPPPQVLSCSRMELVDSVSTTLY